MHEGIAVVITAESPQVLPVTLAAIEHNSAAILSGEIVVAPAAALTLVEHIRRQEKAVSELEGEIKDLERELRYAYSDPRLTHP